MTKLEELKVALDADAAYAAIALFAALAAADAAYVDAYYTALAADAAALDAADAAALVAYQEELEKQNDKA